MEITEAKLKHTPDAVSVQQHTETSDNFWKKWKEFPRWDIAHIVINEKEDKEKILSKLKDNLICQGTWSGKHHITYWKHYNTAEDYEKDQRG